MTIKYFFITLTRLFQHTVQSSGCQVVAWLPRDGHKTQLSRMFLLAMTAPCANEHPAVFFKQPDDISNLHG